MKFDAEAEKRCIMRMTKIDLPSGPLLDLYYGIPGTFHFVRRLVRNEEEGRKVVEEFKRKALGLDNSL